MAVTSSALLQLKFTEVVSMPDEKFITRRKGLIFETPDGTLTHSGQRKGVKAFQKDLTRFLIQPSF